MTRFEGFGPGVREWFLGLEADNTRRLLLRSPRLLRRLGPWPDGRALDRAERHVRGGLLLGSDAALHGLYASISADGLIAGSGYHMMARDQLERYRERAADDRLGPGLAKLLAQAENKGLEIRGALRDANVEDGGTGHRLARRARRRECYCLA